jgi:E1A/CREB-binding protein
MHTQTFSPEGFAPEFPYRQRVVLLFQKLDGVDVCIFCM